MFFVPLVTFIVYPLSLITFCFPFLDSIYNIVIIILEKSSLFLASIPFGKLIFKKPSIVFIILCILLTVLLFELIQKKRYQYLIFYVCFYISYYFYPNLITKDYMVMLDVGQGDSLLFVSQNKTMLIDTGGVMPFSKEPWQQRSSYSIVKKKTIPYLKSLGIRQIDYLVLTHGDYDHLGESINLIDNFKVKHILLNDNEVNFLEEKIIKKAKDKKITIETCIQNKLFQFGNITIQALNKNLEDENDSSVVLLLLFQDKKILLMGDATARTEKYLLNEYFLPKIDILKVGHHGSNTSSSKYFIDSVKPQNCLISVGTDNKFGHPKENVLEALSDCNIYRTDMNGTIVIEFKNNKYNIKTINK